METPIGSQEPVQSIGRGMEREFVQLVNNVPVASTAGLHEVALGFHRDVETMGASRSFHESFGVKCVIARRGP